MRPSHSSSICLPPAVERASVSSQIARIKTFESVRDFFSGSVFLSFLELPLRHRRPDCARLDRPARSSSCRSWQLAFYCMVFYLLFGRIRDEMRQAAKSSSARHRFVIETFEKIEHVSRQWLD